MSLLPPETVGKLQAALHTKAKGSASYRFYALYDKLYRRDVLAYAYQRCRANGGACGVDGQTFADIEAYGLERWLEELTEALHRQTYQPQAVRRVWIPKADGKQRPLGIPTVQDRVVQMAAVLVLEPIFEADLQDEQFAYRPGRSALDALEAVHRLLCSGHTEVVDADLSGYFDSIPHAELLRCVRRRISDRHLIELLARWLEMPVEETDERGRRRRTTRAKDEGRGTPQGAPLSPLLANLYMRRFILGWKTLGHERRLGAYIVNYADDFVICCRGDAAVALALMRVMMSKLKLTVNETKTRLCRVPGETFNFLGYTIGRCYSRQTGRAYIGTRPSAKAVQRICAAVSEATHRGCNWRDPELVVRDLNRQLVGWANYFSSGSVSTAYRAVLRHTHWRLSQWLRRKGVVGQGQTARGLAHFLHDTLGLINLVSYRTSQLSRVRTCES
jgi:RNA-directed DNA polymerase